MPKNKLKNDIILIVSILCLSLIALVIYKSNQSKGSMVKVTVDKQVKDCYNFNNNTETVILSGDKNQYENVLVIKDGYAFIKSANCPDKICVKHHKISKTGETIVCLPHKLVVEITEE
ncbi:MAG: NusG domain II-containing protein [Ruminococcaceae bacterium]|nr:NusG domain II-containing protein [Oscillospiraceae bacterium]